MPDAATSRAQSRESAALPGGRRWLWAIASAPVIAAAFAFGFHALPAEIDTRAVSLSGPWKIHEGHDSTFANRIVDDADWAEIEWPGGYRAQGFSARTCWVRKNFKAPALAPGENGYLTLGNTRGGLARVYLNGGFIGEQGVGSEGFKPDRRGLSGWEFDGRSLRGDGTDAIAVQLTWGRLGYDGIADGRSFVGSAQVLKRYHRQNQVIRAAIDYGGLLACLLAVALMVGLWLFYGEERSRYRAAIVFLSACAYYLVCETGVIIGFFADPVVMYNLLFIALPLLAVGAFEFVEATLAGAKDRPSLARQINRALCGVGFLAGTLLPIDLTHTAVQIASAYLALVLGYAAVVAARAGGDRAVLIAAAFGAMLLAGLCDLAGEAGFISAPQLFPLGVTHMAIVVCIASLGERLARAQVDRALSDQLQKDNAKLAQEVREERSGNDMKARFLATIAGQMDAPLRVVTEAHESLLSDLEVDADGDVVGQSDPVGARERLLTAHVSATEVLDLLRGVNDISALDDEEPEFTRVPVPALTLIEKACNRVSTLAEQRAITITPADVPEDLHPLVDTERCVQVLTHLLKNAIKFSPEGSQVEVSANRAGERCSFVIRDRGAGIAKAHQESIFERFFQVLHTTPGSGLGLALARQLTELQGGQITVESKLGEGSTFTVELPAAKSSAGR